MNLALREHVILMMNGKKFLKMIKYVVMRIHSVATMTLLMMEGML